MADPTADLSRGPVLLSFSLATASFALATTFVRFYVRRGIKGGFGADDYTSGVATIIALISTIFGIVEGTAPDGTRALEFNVVGQPWYLISASLSKISICLFFMGLLRRARQWRILLAGLIIVMAVINLAFALAVYLQCRPLEKVWNPAAAGACSDPSIQINFGYAQGAFSVFSWVFLALFPMLILRDISRGEPTWPFYATSALSFVCGIFVIVRTAQTSQTTGVSIYTIPFFYASLMANLEQNLSLTTSNLLTLGPLFSPSTSTTTSTTTSSTSTSTRRGSKPKKRRDPYSSFSSTGTARSSRRSTTKSNKRPALTTTVSSTSGSVSIPSRAGSSRSITRPDTRASSRASSHRHHHHQHHQHQGEPGGGVEGIDRKRMTHLIIEGPRAAGAAASRDGGEGAEAGAGAGGYGVYGGVGGGYDLGDGNRSNNRRKMGEEGYNHYYHSDDEDDDEDEYGYGSDEEGSEIDLEAWPRGIIKTVSVEVVEEVNEEYVAAVAAAAATAAAAAARAGNQGAAAAAAGSSNAGNNNNNNNSRAARGSGKGVGRNSVTILPGVVGVRQPRAGVDNAERGSGGSGIEQDWEVMLRAGPPR